MASKFRYEIIVTDQFNSYSSPLSIFDLTYVSDPSFQISEVREKGTMHFVKKIKNKIIVTEADFTTFRGYLGNCYKFWVNIYKDCIDGEVLIAKAFFNEKNCSFDFDKCSVEIELQDKNPYDCFKDKKSDRFDIYGGAQAQNLGLYVGPDVFRSMYWGQAVLQVTSFMSCCDEFSCYYNLISDFFDWQDDGFGGTLFPDDQTMTNYVNPSQPNYYLRVCTKSDVISPNASNPATKFLLSFDDIEKVHKEVFNVYWVLEGTRLRWEHYSWFTKTMNYNALSATNFPLNKLKNRIKFAEEDLPEEEIFEFMEANGVDFVGLPIYYNPDCANGKKVNRGMPLLTTDTDYIINTSSAIDINGFVLVDSFKVTPTTWFVFSATGLLSAASQRNGRLSWANLHYDLHRYGRPFITGTMNGNPEIFLSKEPDIIQEGVVTQLCCADDKEKWDSSVRTEIGDGIIDEADIDYSNELITFKIRHSGIPSNI